MCQTQFQAIVSKTSCNNNFETHLKNNIQKTLRKQQPWGTSLRNEFQNFILQVTFRKFETNPSTNCQERIHKQGAKNQEQTSSKTGCRKSILREVFIKRISDTYSKNDIQNRKTENKVQYQSPKRSQKEIAATTSKHKLLKTLAKSTIATKLKWENESQEANLENKKYKKETQTKAESKSKTEFAILFRKRFSKAALKTDPIH